jgi:hypothetical protein
MSFTKTGAGTSVFNNVIGSVKTTITGTPLFTQLSPSATSSAVGAFSLRAVNGLSPSGTARAVAVQAHPVVQWPPVSMTSNTTAVSSQLYGNGTYIATASVPNNGIWVIFDNNISTYYEQATAFPYNYTTGTYIGSNVTTISSVSVSGEWFQVQLPTSIILRSYTLVGRQTGNYWRLRNPTTFWIAGSNNGTTWSNVHQQTNITPPQEGITINVPVTSNSLSYTYYRLVVNVIGNSNNSDDQRNLVNLASWNLYGDASSYAPNAAQDFYADRLGNLLTAPVTGQSLANWLGGATGYVTTWYDQSGRGNDATQATSANQPIIQRATKGPGYACYFLGSQWVSYGTTSTFAATPFSVAVALRRSNGTNRNAYTGWGDPGTTTAWNTNFLTPGDTINFTNRDQNTNSTIPVWTASEGMYYITHTLSNNYYANNYVNGAYSAQSNWQQFLTSAPTSNAQIGRATGQGTPNTFYGEIYEILVFTQSLYDLDTSGGLITKIYQNQLGAYGT